MAFAADRWTRFESAYHGARDRRGEDRSRFLDEVCGSDAPMRQQVEALLEQNERVNSLLDHPAIELTAGCGVASDERPASGTRVGVYEVLECIGSGGMGHVYRARDSQLDREAAMKFLPPHLATDPERLLRLRREAQALAALNHPNIAQVYGLEQS